MSMTSAEATITHAVSPALMLFGSKTPADAPYIKKIARFIKEKTGGLPVVYGGGLKESNAAMLAGIAEIDGGLIALTRFSGEIIDFGFDAGSTSWAPWQLAQVATRVNPNWVTWPW